MLRPLSLPFLAVISSLPLSAPVWGANIVTGVSSPGAGWTQVTLTREETFNTAQIRIRAEGGSRFVHVQAMQFWMPPVTERFFMIDNGVGVPGTDHDVTSYLPGPIAIEIGMLRQVAGGFEQRFTYQDGADVWLASFPVPEPTSAPLLLLTLAALPNALRRRGGSH